MYTPYQHQAEAAEAGAGFLLSSRKRNGIIVAPPGAGKSLIISLIAQQLDGPVLVFQPSKEILEQNLGKFRSYGYSPAVYSASGKGDAPSRDDLYPLRKGRDGNRLCRACGTEVGKRKEYCSDDCQQMVARVVNPSAQVGEVTLATIKSVGGTRARASKARLFQDFPYVIVDECDLVGAKGGQYKAFFNELDVKILGLSATPFRLESNLKRGSILKWLTRTQPRIFHEVVYYIQTGDLFDEGYLARPQYKHWPAINRKAIKVNSTGADYDDKQLQFYFANTHFQGKVVKACKRLLEMGRKSLLVFTRYIPEAEYVVNEIPGAAIVTSDTPKSERTNIVEAFKAGKIPVVANVNCLSVGFDYPELDTVVIARPTKSLRLYYQICGRVIRPSPGKEPLIVDLVGLVQEFGKIEDLKIVDGGNGKWFIENTERQLTNVYFANDGASRCDDCGAPFESWMMHVDTKRRAPLQRPGPGQQGNINLVRRDGKTYYTVVPAGQGEFVHHAAVCQRRRMTG